jgi:hypothetical protein
MRNLNQKQQKWVIDNTPIGKVLQEGRYNSKIIGHEHGYVNIETTIITEASEENYNMGLITKEEFSIGEPLVSTRIHRISYTSPIWNNYFPELKNIKSK